MDAFTIGIADMFKNRDEQNLVGDTDKGSLFQIITLENR